MISSLLEASQPLWFQQRNSLPGSSVPNDLLCELSQGKLSHTNEVITELLMNGISDWARIVCPGPLVQMQLEALKIFACNQL